MLLWIPIFDETADIGCVILSLDRRLANHLLDLHAAMEALPQNPNTMVHSLIVTLNYEDALRAYNNDETECAFRALWATGKAAQVFGYPDVPGIPIAFAEQQIALPQSAPEFGFAVQLADPDEGRVLSADAPWKFVLQAAGVRL